MRVVWAKRRGCPLGTRVLHGRRRRRTLKERTGKTVQAVDTTPHIIIGMGGKTVQTVETTPHIIKGKGGKTVQTVETTPHII